VIVFFESTFLLPEALTWGVIRKNPLDFYRPFGENSLHLVQALLWSLIGNPVKTGDGPAAVTSSLRLFEEGNSFSCGTPLSAISGWEGRWKGEGVRRPAWSFATAFEVRGCC
jgi:hypothetical protein